MRAAIFRGNQGGAPRRRSRTGISFSTCCFPQNHEEAIRAFPQGVAALILIDSNVVMYAAGKNHPHKVSCIALLERVADGRLEALIDAEVLQEILHRYRALRRWKDGRNLYDLVRKIFPIVVPITAEATDRARDLLEEYDLLMARDALHAAIVELHAEGGICSYDTDFDRIKTLQRFEPADLVKKT